MKNGIILSPYDLIRSTYKKVSQIKSSGTSKNDIIVKFSFNMGRGTTNISNNIDIELLQNGIKTKCKI